jgi:hypothetical protein
VRGAGDQLASRGAFRLWLEDRSAWLGLLIAGAFAAIVAVVALPFGFGKSIDGVIVRFGLTETDTGGYPVAVVRLPTTEFSVPLPRANDCKVGGRIHLVEFVRVWGRSYGPAMVPCP